MVWLVFVIGALNLCLGYAMAVYLGYGPPSFWDAWDALSAPRSAGDVSSDPDEQPQSSRVDK